MKTKTALTHTYASESESHSVLSETLCNPWAIESMELSRPEQWSGSAFPSPGYLPNPGIEPRSPALQGDSLPAEPPGKLKNTGVGSLSLLQEIFPTQGSNPSLLNCRWILYQLSYQGSPIQHSQLSQAPLGFKSRFPIYQTGALTS